MTRPHVEAGVADDLHRYLQQSRESVLSSLDGLSEYDVRRPMTPSATNLLGLIKHLAGVELGYLGDSVGRPAPVRLPWVDDGSIWDSADIWATAEEARDELVGLYRAAWRHSDESISQLGLDAPAQVSWWPEERCKTTLGALLVRVVAETAQHAGHADILREMIDGRAGRDHDDVGDAAWWARHLERVQQAADRHRGTTSSASGRRVRTGGITLTYDVTGRQDAAPMVLLHALGDRGSSWAPVTAMLAEHLRVFTFDLRGHGDSDWPGTYSFRLMRDDVLGALDELGLDKVTLVGHSMGGVVAYLVAMTRPESVERLIVEDAPPPFPRDRAIPERPTAPLDFDWAVVPAIIGQVNEGDPAAWDGLAAITAPTLLIGGGPESHIPQDKLVEVADRVPCAELVTIPAGHNVHAACPSEFASVVLRWLRDGDLA